MEKIRIGEAMHEAIVRHGGSTLSLTFEKARIEEIAALLSEENAPEIRVMHADGTTKAIYKNHALNRVQGETMGGVYRVTAALSTQTIEQSEADALREEIALLRRENELLTDCVLEMSEAVYA